MQERWYVLPLMLLLGAGVAGAAGEPGSGPQKDPARKDPVMQRDKEAAPPITSASGIAAAKKGQPVKLRGQIVSKKGRNDYVFADDTGNAVVESDSKILKGNSLPAGTDVEIEGQVDTSFFGGESKVETKWITVLASSGKPGGSPGGSSAPSKAPQQKK
jgi:uncharacterized protein (TIGR00156 family)